MKSALVVVATLIACEVLKLLIGQGPAIAVAAVVLIALVVSWPKGVHTKHDL